MGSLELRLRRCECPVEIPSADVPGLAGPTILPCPGHAAAVPRVHDRQLQRRGAHRGGRVPSQRRRVGLDAHADADAHDDSGPGHSDPDADADAHDDADAHANTDADADTKPGTKRISAKRLRGRAQHTTRCDLRGTMPCDGRVRLHRKQRPLRLGFDSRAVTGADSAHRTSDSETELLRVR